MRILVLTHFIPYPATSGGRMRTLELIRYLRKRHDVTVVAFTFGNSDVKAARELAKECERVIAVPFGGCTLERNDRRPRLITRFWTPEMRRYLAKLNREDRFDFVQIEHIFMAQYAPFIDAPAILQEHNIESILLRRSAELEADQTSTSAIGAAVGDARSLPEWRKMSEYESLIWPQFPLRFVVSEVDRREMMRRCTAGRAVCIPNGVDTETFRSVADLNTSGVLFTGTFEHQPNVDAAGYLCHAIWPMVKAAVPNARLYIIGLNPPAHVKAFAQSGSIEVVPNASSIVPFARKSSVSVVPIRVGGGTRLKILISMALGLSVISTSIGCEGLDLQDGRELIKADDPNYFAEQLIELLTNRDLRSALSRAGRRAVEQRYQWRQILPLLESEYERFVHPKPFLDNHEIALARPASLVGTQKQIGISRFAC